MLEYNENVKEKETLKTRHGAGFYAGGKDVKITNASATPKEIYAEVKRAIRQSFRSSSFKTSCMTPASGSPVRLTER